MPVNLVDRTSLVDRSEELSRREIAEPTHEEISKLAYALWLEHGGGEGSAEQDWLEAEQQLRQRPQRPEIRTQAA